MREPPEAATASIYEHCVPDSDGLGYLRSRWQDVLMTLRARDFAILIRRGGRSSGSSSAKRPGLDLPPRGENSPDCAQSPPRRIPRYSHQSGDRFRDRAVGTSARLASELGDHDRHVVTTDTPRQASRNCWAAVGPSEWTGPDMEMIT